MTDAPEAVEARPSWTAFHRRLVMRMIWLGPLVVLAVIVASWPSLGLAFVILGLALLLGGLAFMSYFARTRVRVGGGVVRVRGPIRGRSWALPDIGTLVFVPLPGSTPGATVSTLYAVSPGLERMFSLSGELWEADELERIAEAIAAPVVRAPTGLAPAQLRQRFPGTIGWLATRPWLVMLLVLAGTMLVMFVGVILASLVLYATGQVTIPTSG